MEFFGEERGEEEGKVTSEERGKEEEIERKVTMRKRKTMREREKESSVQKREKVCFDVGCWNNIKWLFKEKNSV